MARTAVKLTNFRFKIMDFFEVTFTWFNLANKVILFFEPREDQDYVDSSVL